MHDHLPASRTMAIRSWAANMAMVGAAPASTSTLTKIDVPSAAGDWSITLPTKMVPSELVGCGTVGRSRHRDQAYARGRASSRLPGARPGASFRPTIGAALSRNCFLNDCGRKDHRSFDEIESSSLAHKITQAVSRELPLAASRRAA